jgi:sn-glycerol 3-phosphate transport system substrate-binding protein
MQRTRVALATLIVFQLLLSACAGPAAPTPTPVPPRPTSGETAPTARPVDTAVPPPTAAPTAVPPTPVPTTPPKPDKITLEFWYSLAGSSGQAVEELVKRFNASQSYITVNATYQGAYAEIMAKVWNAIYAEMTLPNVAQLGGAPLVGATGAAVAITDFTDGPNGIERSQIYDAFWDYNKAGGTVWSMPFNNSMPVLYYNKDLFVKAGLDPEKPPETWDDVIRYGQMLTRDTDGNNVIDQWGFNTHDDTHWYLSTMMLSNGAQIINAEETEVLYNSPEAVEMLTLWGDLVNDVEIMPPAQHKEARSDFPAGTLAMLLRSSSVLPSQVTDAPFALGVGMVPAVAGKPRKVPIGGGSLVIFKNQNPYLLDAAWEFVKFMTNEPSSLYLSTQTGYLPIYKNALQWPEMQTYLETHPLSRVTIEQLEYAYAIPIFSALGTSDGALRQAVEAVEFGASDPQAALDQAKMVVDQNIQEQLQQ